MPKAKFGKMKCPDCPEPVVVKINTENETLSYSCQECDGNGYCKKGEGRYPGWLSRIERTAAPAGDAKPAPVTKEKKYGLV